jgi:hypothetical protein
VNAECTSFRRALERKLLGRPSQQGLLELSWHEHLLACGECRALLEAEEALEILLATLPDPRLPPRLAARVLSRLRVSAEGGLDALLELDSEVAAPDRLAARVLAGVRAGMRADAQASLPHRTPDERLDALLDLDRDVAVPAGLSARVLNGLRLARRRRAIPRWVYAAAAAILVALCTWAGWAIWARDRGAEHHAKSLLVANETPPDPQMLAALDVLEVWDLATKDDVDVLLSTLGPADEALLDFQSDTIKGSEPK